jgi:glycosyltransferase involved in cell wall biosynthesis
MRVLIPVDHAVGVSGPHRNVVGSLNALGARDDVEVVLLTGRIDPGEPYASAPHIDVHLGFAPHDPKRVPQNVWRIQRAARGCDVIYVPSGLKSFLYAQSVRRGRRLVAGPNVTPLPFGKRHDSPGKLELKYMSDAWFEMSRSRQAHVRRQSGVREVGVIHHAIDLDKFSPNRRRMEVWSSNGVPPDSIKVIFVGRDNEPRKGVPQLLDAADLLAASGRGDIHTILVGRMSDETRARAGVLPHVSVLGVRTGVELAELYASADIAVIPSSWESFGFTVLEAMASGLPVISSRSGGIPEIIDDGISGVLLDLVDQQTRHHANAGHLIANAIAELASNAEARQGLGRAARARAEGYFSEDRLGNDLMAVFQGIAVPGPPDRAASGAS